MYWDMDQAARLQEGYSRSINWENRTGEKGKGGMAASVLHRRGKARPVFPVCMPMKR